MLMLSGCELNLSDYMFHEYSLGDMNVREDGCKIAGIVEDFSRDSSMNIFINDIAYKSHVIGYENRDISIFLKDSKIMNSR